MKDIEILMKMKELLKKPSAWTQQAFGRTSDGLACSSLDCTCVCWYLRGAFYRVQGEVPTTSSRLSSAINSNWNDMPCRSHEEVMAWIDSQLKELDTLDSDES